MCKPTLQNILLAKGWSLDRSELAGDSRPASCYSFLGELGQALYGHGGAVALLVGEWLMKVDRYQQQIRQKMHI